MANFLLSPPTTYQRSIDTLYNPYNTYVLGARTVSFVNKKTPITGPGSFDNASFLSKLARVMLASICIIITLGLVLCCMSTQNLLDLDIRCSCIDDAEYVYYYPPYLYDPSIFSPKPEILFSSWDHLEISTHLIRLSEKHSDLFVPSLYTPSTCFSIERAVLKDLHLYDSSTQSVLDHPDSTQCHHQNNYQDYPHLADRDCQNFRIYAYPLWHHPSAHNPEEMNSMMLSTARRGFAGISHWTLVIVNLDRREVVFFDSLANFINNRLIDPALNSIATRLGNVYPDANGALSPFIVKKVIKTPIQQDSTSCGIWLSLFLDKYLDNPDYVPPLMGGRQAQYFLQEFLETIPQRPITQASDCTLNVLGITCDQVENSSNML
ncbi:Ulp1 family isopeptidase [Chlamydia abortus]|uniref:Conserved membrane protein n=2 Tax=Chlamydia abortus TaxID=83555 RepID=Q5L5G1_CHLAB|nr:Ulp1 family isopeptidase [Chlamydia abortus]QRR31448.1 hypothetical protein JS522_03570 [Chlamydia abortus]CAH64130.1 conserved membrane protein [Chlamydia abortus S26/3]CED80735.1 conserved membrane protein [Chlamydia abortus]CED81695.1 conserved membrane protein [Chlamydia abortus]CEF17141.1 conserved membrane protein [Chlamydia abortus]